MRQEEEKERERCVTANSEEEAWELSSDKTLFQVSGPLHLFFFFSLYRIRSSFALHCIASPLSQMMIQHERWMDNNVSTPQYVKIFWQGFKWPNSCRGWVCVWRSLSYEYVLSLLACLLALSYMTTRGFLNKKKLGADVPPLTYNYTIESK